MLNDIVCARASFLRVVSSCREIPAETGSFDKVLSCEMIEAVGQEHLVTYFTAIDAALKPGGKASIQV
jgi:cyclopropane fatty-acyl-phospholipid synthase-like methyltransferase